MSNSEPPADYGGKDMNKRLSYPGRKFDWARMSPAPFLNRRFPRRDWMQELPNWQAPTPAPTNQESLHVAVTDAVWFEVIRQTPLQVAPADANMMDDFRFQLQTQVENAFAKHPKPPGVEELSLYDMFQALAKAPTPMFVDTLGHVKVEGTPLPRDLEYWRDWIARRGPIAGLIWVDERFRRDGTYTRSELDAPKDVAPAAVVIAGYNHVFRSLESIELTEDDYTLRPSFEIGAADDPRPQRVRVGGDFADKRFIEAFGLTVTVTL